jgi:hypothetical protein
MARDLSLLDPEFNRFLESDMTSRPDAFARRVPAAAATLVGRRPWPARDRNRATTWRFFRRTKKYLEVGARPDPAGFAFRASAGIATRLSYTGRLITFNLAVALIHLAIVRWILLPIGG